METIFTTKDGLLDLSKVEILTRESNPRINANRYDIKPNWDVIVSLSGCDDRAEIYFNETLVATKTIFDGRKPTISLKYVLHEGENRVRIVNINGREGRQIGYKIGIFDENDRPVYSFIDINIETQSKSASGIVYDVTYVFNKIL